MSSKWKYPGARWWKFDFHTHTPASMDTGAWQAAIGTPQELTPETWLLQYMAAEIDCVAVTDHNSGEWIDKLKSAYQSMKSAAAAGAPAPGYRDIHLFPGVEISVQGGFHLLAIFDTSASSQTISDLLAVVRYDGTRGASDGITREGAAKVVEEVLAAGGVAIPAHVDGDKGLLQAEPGTRKCQLDAATVKQVLQVPGILALEWCDPALRVPAVLEELKLRFAKVIGSDCHSFQGPAVPGSRYTLVKMATPSLEGLRLALLDGQGVSIRRSDDGDGFAPLDKPAHFIESIEISNALWMGLGKRPAHLELTPYFNALVGGRGTGKSTVVHALRIAYERDQELATGTEAQETFRHFKKLPDNRNPEGGLRSDTQFTVQLNRHETTFRLLWRQDRQGPMVQEWNEALKAFETATSQAINAQRFPIRLFSQGQIAALASGGQQALLGVIDAAAGTSTYKAAFDEVRRSFLSTRAQLRDLDGKLQSRDALVLRVQDVQRVLARFEVADNAAVLRNYQLTSRQDRELNRQFESAADLADRIKTLAEELLAEDMPEGLLESHSDHSALLVVQQLQAAIARARVAVEGAATQLAERGLSLRAELDTSTWLMQVAEAKIAYEKLKSELQQQGVSDPSEYGRLVQEKQRLEGDVKRLDSLQRQRQVLQQQGQRQLEQVVLARRAISANRQAFLTETLRGNGFVHMTLVPYSRDPHAVSASLREVLGAAEGKYVEDLFVEAQDSGGGKGLVADILLSSLVVEAIPGQPAAAAFENALGAAKTRLESACRGSGGFGGWFNKFLKSESEKRPELLDNIACWFPEDGLEVKYSRKGDGNNFQPIAQASAGQRAAAMLAFLLAHGDEPLVLDQPEDDLDNHLIYDLVVSQIRENKQRRQLIIVTHNPNIVVNGDAELIHVLDFNNQCFVKQTGSLQEQKMRQEVCQVMEGGKEAFERRYQRLGREV